MPYDFYCMEWKDYLLKCQGYNKKLEREADYLNLITFTIHRHLSPKPMSFEKWTGKKNTGTIERLRRKQEELKQKQLHGN
jgi:hypothetical protein